MTYNYRESFNSFLYVTSSFLNGFTIAMLYSDYKKKSYKDAILSGLVGGSIAASIDLILPTEFKGVFVVVLCLFSSGCSFYKAYKVLKS